MATRKAAKKATGRPFAKDDPRINRTKPGPGRPPDEFKAMCRDLASRDDTRNRVAAILDDPTHPQFMAALRWATENGYGKAPQSLEVSGKDGGPVEVRQTWVVAGREIVF